MNNIPIDIVPHFNYLSMTMNDNEIDLFRHQ